MTKYIKNKFNNRGAMLIYIVIVLSIFIIVMVPVLNLIAGQIKLTGSAISKEQALQIAEAGINYYQWHLAHYPEDYKDGTTGSGPYVHDYIDVDTQQKIGEFSLVVTPPAVGSTIVTLKSTGYTTKNPEIKRTITVRYGIYSLSKYAFLSNDVVWIGEDESVSGQLHSNNGIRFDGVGNAPIQSAKSTYKCQSSHGCVPDTYKPGIWGSASQAVKNFWSFPVPAIDFSSLTADLSKMKSLANSGGIYLSPSGAKGYLLNFNSNSTISIYKITRLSGNNYDNKSLLQTKSMPATGIIFVEDNVWVQGTVNGRVTVAAAKLPETTDKPTIYIQNNILYSAKDGTSVLGLISQKDVLVTSSAPTNLEIDAAMVSQSGAIQYPESNDIIKDSITIYGSIMSFGQWTWTWVSSGYSSTQVVVHGYKVTHSNYDSNLLYGAPPSFPVSSSGYQQLSWTSD